MYCCGTGPLRRRQSDAAVPRGGLHEVVVSHRRRAQRCRASDHVIDRLTAAMNRLPDRLRSTLTWDQGSEMARHTRFSLATDCTVYFCDPHSPCQRGSNENTNGLLRQYFPKGQTNFAKISQAE